MNHVPVLAAYAIAITSAVGYYFLFSMVIS